MGKLRKQLSASGLLGTARKSFDTIADPRRAGSPISLADALMSGVAVFSLKYASLLPILWTLFDKKVPSPHIGIFNHQTKETHTRGKRHHGLGKKDTQ